jgi:hypothetical protein
VQRRPFGLQWGDTVRKVFAVCLIALASQAYATLIIDTSIGKYDVSPIQAGGGEGGSRFLDNLEGVDFMPWWGNRTLAEEFAVLVGDGLGLPNGDLFSPPPTTGTPGGFFGPLFAFDTVFDQPQVCATLVCSRSFAWQGFVSDHFVSEAYVRTYAIARKVTTSVPEPGTLALFAVGLLSLGLLRLRRRIA